MNEVPPCDYFIGNWSEEGACDLYSEQGECDSACTLADQASFRHLIFHGPKTSHLYREHGLGEQQLEKRQQILDGSRCPQVTQYAFDLRKQEI